MKTISILFFVLFCLSAYSGYVYCEDSDNIILIGWDGAQRQHVEELLSEGLLINLRKLFSKGNYVDIDIVGETCTTPGWAQILTGCEPQTTGVINNRVYGMIPEGLTAFERLKNEPDIGPVITVLLAGKNKSFDLPYSRAREEIDFFKIGLGPAEEVGEKALETIKTYHKNRFFLFVHFREPDSQGHEFGENSREYNDGLITCDKWLGKITGQLKQLGIYDNTLVYVTSDHGFDEGQTHHNYAPYVFLTTNDSSDIRNGRAIDILPTILDRLDIEFSEMDGVSLLVEED